LTKSREELRRGIMALSRDTSRQLRDLEGAAPASEPSKKPLLPDPETLARQAESAGGEPMPAQPASAGQPGPSEPVLQLDVLSADKTAAEAAGAGDRGVEADARGRRKVAYLPGIEPPAAADTTPASAAPAPQAPELPAGTRAEPDADEPPSRKLDEARERLLRAELEDLAHYDERRGVCFAFFLNRNCWEVDDAFCNRALHVCMLRNCPVYHLHQETLEKRFAAKYKHLW
jgi:hypothetical protein